MKNTRILKNKKADITNFLRKKVVSKEITFPRKVKSKSECLLFKNKKADIAITILVIGVVALCAMALFSFYVVGDRHNIHGKVNSVFYLQEVYNLAESVKYSGGGLTDKYNEELSEYDIQGFVIRETYYKKDLGIKGDEEVLKVEYDFGP